MYKRFANDFDRIDTVKADDRLLIQDSADGIVKFANPSQLPASGSSCNTPLSIEYVNRTGKEKNTPAFRVKGLTDDVAQYRMFFYRHLKTSSCVPDPINTTGPRKYTKRYGWLHPDDGKRIYEYDDKNNPDRAQVMLNPRLRDELVIMSEFELAPTSERDIFVLRHTGGRRGSNMVNPEEAVSVKDIVSPFVWLETTGPDDNNRILRTSFGRTIRGWDWTVPKAPAGVGVGIRGVPLRNMGFALNRITFDSPERVTDILPFAAYVWMNTSRNGGASASYR